MSAKRKMEVVKVETPAIIRLDIGCGKSVMPNDEWIGIDTIDFGQKLVKDVREGIPYPDNSVDEVKSSHFVEHLTGAERISFFNELYRVMKKGAQAQIVTPCWSHACAYGDPTHQWPPMSQWYPLYLNKGWRDTQSPHVPYTCDFDYVIAGSWDQSLECRTMEYKQSAMNTQINGWRDLIVTLTAK